MVEWETQRAGRIPGLCCLSRDSLTAKGKGESGFVMTVLVVRSWVSIMPALMMGVGGTCIGPAVRPGVMTATVIRSRSFGMLLGERRYG